MSKRCRVCNYRLDDYDPKCDTCGACIDMGNRCACGAKGVLCKACNKYPAVTGDNLCEYCAERKDNEEENL